MTGERQHFGFLITNCRCSGEGKTFSHRISICPETGVHRCTIFPCIVYLCGAPKNNNDRVVVWNSYTRRAGTLTSLHPPHTTRRLEAQEYVRSSIFAWRTGTIPCESEPLPPIFSTFSGAKLRRQMVIQNQSAPLRSSTRYDEHVVVFVGGDRYIQSYTAWPRGDTAVYGVYVCRKPPIGDVKAKRYFLPSALERFRGEMYYPVSRRRVLEDMLSMSLQRHLATAKTVQQHLHRVVEKQMSRTQQFIDCLVVDFPLL